MAGQAPTTRRELEAELIGRASKDEAFRRALVDDPTGTLERELGVQVPEGVTLTVVEETPTSRYVVLPHRPAGGGRELSDTDLDDVAGGVIAAATASGCGAATASGCLF
jgi:hypothetical protein